MTKSVKDVEATVKLRVKRIKHLEGIIANVQDIGQNTLNKRLQALEDKEVALEAKIDMLTDALENVRKTNRNEDNLQFGKCKEYDKNLNRGQNHQKPCSKEEQKLKCDECEYSCHQDFEMKKHKYDEHELCKLKKCDICHKTFLENCDLERHMQTHHKVETFDCEKCDKTFVLKWRLRKHQSLHKTNKFCNYFNNEKVRPFEEIGCKFLHELSPTCKFKKCENLMCQYRHKLTPVVHDETKK